ncbi:hypothetical protein RRG08_025989 [Elysia crispata]|uniref:Uncharacterized protein n=1 Tax=Elysia crispata TaxID=231223 RepID=A0AAE0ZHA0_9GAST|nr:hypothetical protein RRG08_025989 [Elysia crispata]
MLTPRSSEPLLTSAPTTSDKNHEPSTWLGDPVSRGSELLMFLYLYLPLPTPQPPLHTLNPKCSHQS